MTRRLTLALCALALLGAVPSPASAQKSLADVLGREATPEGKPKTYLEEIMLFSYVENSYVANLGRTGRGDVNELRFYDHDNGYTFNAAELSVKKDPSERYRLGWGVVVTAGGGFQKKHPPRGFPGTRHSSPLFRHHPQKEPAHADAAH